uniref:Uncharacterized protein n=1 Tax=Oryza sativa subsp. japonica TaxID=39947 RepID=Q10BG4_ORYSJ|nr:hypothetical protein LOC_Os03g60449 [Oryza sativa Japonica Group]
MSSKDRFFDNKILDDFAVGRSNLTGDQQSNHVQLYYMLVDCSRHKQRYIRYVYTKEQLSTRLGRGRVHRIIENDLDKCRVVAPNLPTKTDDLSHSTGRGWTTREKVVNG